MHCASQLCVILPLLHLSGSYVLLHRQAFKRNASTKSLLHWNDAAVPPMSQCLVLALIGDGTGGKCIYGKPFFDETNPLTMDAVGVLATVAQGADNNTSQFVLNLASAPKMVDKGHVVFGKLVKQIPADALETIGKVSAEQC